MARILLKNCRIFDGFSFSEGDILTEGKKIAAIAPKLGEHADFVYDADRCLVLPGLVDLHTHMLGVSSYDFGISAEMSCIPFGVTSAADASAVYGSPELLDAHIVKSRVFVCPSITENGVDFTHAERMLNIYGKRAVGAKVYFDAKMTPVRDGGPLRAIVDFARERDLIVMVHSSNSPIPIAELLDCLRPGDVMTHAYHGGVNTVADDNFASLKSAAERGVVIDAGLAGHVHTDFKIFADAIASGAEPDVISSDITRCSCFKRGGRYGLTMCMSIARTLGMREENILRAVTSTPAKVLGCSGEWGKLAVGHAADIAVLDYGDEPFELTDARGNTVRDSLGYYCALTIADGEVVYRAR